MRSQATGRFCRGTAGHLPSRAAVGCTWDTALRTWPSLQPLQGPRLQGQGRSVPPNVPWTGGWDFPSVRAGVGGRPSGTLTADRVLSLAAHGLPGEQRCKGHVRVPRSALLLPAHALRLPVSVRGPVRCREAAWGAWCPSWPEGRARAGAAPCGHLGPTPRHPGAPTAPPGFGSQHWARAREGRRFAVSSSGWGLGSRAPGGTRGPRSHCEPARPGNYP